MRRGRLLKRIATPRWNLACAAGVHEFRKSTAPNCSGDLAWPCPKLGVHSVRKGTSAAMRL